MAIAPGRDPEWTSVGKPASHPRVARRLSDSGSPWKHSRLVYTSHSFDNNWRDTSANILMNIECETVALNFRLSYPSKRSKLERDALHGQF